MIYLSSTNKDKIQIPIMPEEIGVNDSRNFEDVTLANGDEKSIISGRNLKTISFSSYFPMQDPQYMVAGEHNGERVGVLLTFFFKDPLEYVKKITKWMDSKKVLLLQITNLKVSMNVTIRSFEWKEVGGSGGDIDYTIEFKEYQPVDFKKIKPPKKKSTGGKKTPPKKTRPGVKKETPKTHTVKSGESLWKIAQKYYKDGSLNMKIYNANKKVIGKNPNLIFPGQKLVIPPK